MPHNNWPARMILSATDMGGERLTSNPLPILTLTNWKDSRKIPCNRFCRKFGPIANHQPAAAPRRELGVSAAEALSPDGVGYATRVW